jgi:membrane-bound metal-dependent hydrolase YbcI (DUF457 family)
MLPMVLPTLIIGTNNPTAGNLLASLNMMGFTIIGMFMGLVGVLIGCLLPDTDLSRSKIDYIQEGKLKRKQLRGLSPIEKQIKKTFFKLLSWFIFLVGQFTKHVLNPITSRIMKGISKKQINTNHRGITHSLCGITINCILFGIIILIIDTVLILIYKWDQSIILWISLYWLGGILLGYTLHLVEDSCTISGIPPLYPFSNKRLFGKLRTGDISENKIKLFATLNGIGLVVFIILSVIWSPLTILTMIGLNAICFIIPWLIILFISGVKFSHKVTYTPYMPHIKEV